MEPALNVNDFSCVLRFYGLGYRITFIVRVLSMAYCFTSEGSLCEVCLCFRIPNIFFRRQLCVCAFI